MNYQAPIKHSLNDVTNTHDCVYLPLLQFELPAHVGSDLPPLWLQAQTPFLLLVVPMSKLGMSTMMGKLVSFKSFHELVWKIVGQLK